MQVGSSVDCIFCLQPGALNVRVDKRGRPFLKCGCCSTTAFIHGNGMKGLQMLYGRLSMAMSNGDAEAARVMFQKEVTNGEPSRAG